MPQRDEDPEDRVPPPGLGRSGTKVLEIAENVVYGGIAAFLILSAVLLLAVAAKTTWGVVHDFTATPLLEVLDVLLLVFIVVELLFALRTTVERRELVAEPFLIVGIIASIKEIILLSVEVANVLEGKATTEGSKDPQEFAMLIALLGLLVMVLAASAVLLRLKERQPVEGKQNEKHSEDADGDGRSDDKDVA
jgi:uncharacterized membrane protein (DUF373 family)